MIKGAHEQSHLAASAAEDAAPWRISCSSCLGEAAMDPQNVHSLADRQTEPLTPGKEDFSATIKQILAFLERGKHK
jgi:hypothetical protein